MFATLVTLMLIGFATSMLAQMVRRDGRKMLAALRGNSWTAEPPAMRPITVRFSTRYSVMRPARTQPALRAAA